MVVTMEEYLSMEEDVIVGNWRKGKLKTCQKLQPISDEQERSVLSAAYRTKAVQVWSWGNRYSPKPGNWPSQHLYLKRDSGFHIERISLKKLYLKVVKLGSYMKQQISE